MFRLRINSWNLCVQYKALAGLHRSLWSSTARWWPKPWRQPAHLPHRPQGSRVQKQEYCWKAKPCKISSMSEKELNLDSPHWVCYQMKIRTQKSVKTWSQPTSRPTHPTRPYFRVIFHLESLGRLPWPQTPFGRGRSVLTWPGGG